MWAETEEDDFVDSLAPRIFALAHPESESDASFDCRFPSIRAVLPGPVAPGLVGGLGGCGRDGAGVCLSGFFLNPAPDSVAAVVSGSDGRFAGLQEKKR